jgi:hypothetical protein
MKNVEQNSSLYFGTVSFDSCIKLNQINNMCISPHVGPVVMEVFSGEEKVEQVVPGGSQASSCEELNLTLEQGTAQCISIL